MPGWPFLMQTSDSPAPLAALEFFIGQSAFARLRQMG